MSSFLTALVVTLDRISHSMGYSGGGGGLQRGGRTCIHSFLQSKMTLYQIKHFHMWTVAAVVGLAAQGQGSKPKDGLCSSS